MRRKPLTVFIEMSAFAHTTPKSPRRLLVVLAAALGILAVVGMAADRADGAIYRFDGSFSRADGAVRCTLTAGWAECVSMHTGRVAIINRNGTTETYFTEDAVNRGRRTNQILVNRGQTIACRASGRYVSCFALKWNSGFTLDTQYTLTRDFGYREFHDDSPPVAPVPAGYVPPVYYSPSYVIPDYSDPGGTYGTISDVTGLPRTYYVRPYTRSDGTYVSGYYRSCSRCN
jgi:hypothetical protein